PAPEGGIGVQDRCGEPGVDLRIHFADVDLSERYPVVRPGDLDRAVGEVPVAVFLDERHAVLPARGDAENEVEHDRLIRKEQYALPDRHDGIEYGTARAREFPG